MDQKISGGAGMPDAWQRLWAPHRLSYLEGENRPAPTDEANSDGCPFCRDRKSTRLNSSHVSESRMPSSA